MSYKSYNNIIRDSTPQIDNALLSLCPEIKTLQQKQQLLKENKVVCIDVFADWCQPCKAIAPTYAMMARKFNDPGKCMLVKENVDANLSQNVTGVPCFLFFSSGKYVDSVTGADLKRVEAILAELQKQ